MCHAFFVQCPSSLPDDDRLPLLTPTQGGGPVPGRDMLSAIKSLSTKRVGSIQEVERLIAPA